MKSYPFLKIQGAQNDFVFFSMPPPSDPAQTQMFIRAATHRHKGIGADGLVFAHKVSAQWRWRFFNSDGSETGLCGNAARCMAAYLLHLGESPTHLQWTGTLGEFKAQARGPGQFAVTWPLPNLAVQNVSSELMADLLPLNDVGLAGASLVHAGVPHLVLLNHEQWSLEHRLNTSPDLRNHPTLGAEGANVTWVSLKTNEAVTYERGVEAETQSCGSGALAAFLAVEKHRRENSNESEQSSLSFTFPGDPLVVRRDQNESSRLWLEGPAKIVFAGTWDF